MTLRRSPLVWTRMRSTDRSRKVESRRTAMVGGSFDPVHLGHLHLIHAVLTRTDYRRIILVPVAHNNFKRDQRPAPAEDRLAMLRLAVEAYASLYPDDPLREIVVDDCELVRGGVSYTADTARDIKGRYALAGKLGVVMGDDLVSGLPAWHAFDELKRMVAFVVIRRQSVTPVVPQGVDIQFVGGDVFEDSSSEIRAQLASLGPDEPMPEETKALMPKGVAEYVEAHRLYRD